MPTTAAPPRRSNGLNLDVDILGRPRRCRPAYALEHLENAKPFPLAQAIGTRGVVGDRLSHDMALRLPEAVGCASYPANGRLVKRKSHFYHTEAILPYLS